LDWRVSLNITATEMSCVTLVLVCVNCRRIIYGIILCVHVEYEFVLLHERALQEAQDKMRKARRAGLGLELNPMRRHYCIEPVKMQKHLLFNWLNFLFFRERGYERGFSIESGPLAVAMFMVIPYVMFSEVYFWRQRRFFVMFGQRIAGLIALEERAETLYVSNLAVSPLFRRAGVATYILSCLALWAQSLGKRALELSVNKANVPAIRLYFRCDFRRKVEKTRTHILRREISACGRSSER